MEIPESIGKNILIVDNDPSTLEFLTILLGAHGYSTQIAASGIQALKVASGNIDLILLSTVLPDQDGISICKQLKSQVRSRDVPIIMISNNNKNDQIKSLYLGADDYLNKPFDPQELFARIHVVLRRNNTTIQKRLAKQQHEIVTELQRIIDEEAINVCFQPIYYLKPMRLLGLEMLSRPQTKGLMVNPEIFFRCALKYGVYYDVEMIGWNKALRTVCNVLESREKLFLNCNPYLIESEKFKNVKQLFLKYNMPTSEVYLEITERSAVIGYDLFFQRLKEYRDDGFKIVVDDMGAGYSSLETIVEVRPEVIKLDKHIIKGLNKDPFKISMVRLIVSFCKDNGIVCVAEGIECEEDFNRLIELGVDAGQGYYLCRPLDILEIAAMRAVGT